MTDNVIVPRELLSRIVALLEWDGMDETTPFQFAASCDGLAKELADFIAQPAPAQDEQQAFEAWVRGENVAGCVADMQLGWMARAARPAQAEQQPEQSRLSLLKMIDAAMVEMRNISPPLLRSDCDRLIRAALSAQGGQHE